MKSLQWLRGWVSPKAVQHEFNDMKKYIEETQCTHKMSYFQKIQECFKWTTLRPFFLIILSFAISQSNGITAIRPFMVQLFQKFGVPIDASWASVSISRNFLFSLIFIKNFYKQTYRLL